MEKSQSHAGSRNAMKDDIEKIWAQIDKDFDADDAQEIDDYLKKKGWLNKTKDSVTDVADTLIDQSLLKDDEQRTSPSEKYRIIKQLDFGGQSDIYLAERSDGVYHKTVIIKFISNLYQHEGSKQQFLQEMQMLADLNHPGVVGIIDGGISEHGQPWLVLEYIQGDHIDQHCIHQKLSEHDIVKLMIDLCEALRFVHRRDVLHLDIKPNNVLIKSINHVPYPVLIDFGIAQNKGQQKGETFATLGYTAPETSKPDCNPDQRADIYALGMLLAQLLCRNETPNIGTLSTTERTELLKKQAVNSDLLAIISQATQKDRRFRYQNTEALRNDLHHYLQGLPLSMDSGFWSIIGKGIKRHKWLTAAISVLFVLSIYFSVNYTQRISHMQKITLQEKQQSDELMSFMLGELYDKLAKIGRVDVLQSVTEKSVNHLAKQDATTMSDLDHLHAAKAYMNAGKVFDALELSQQGKQAFLKAKENLKPLESLPQTQYKRQNLLGEINVSLSQVLSMEGQEEATETILTETVRITEGLLKLGMLDKPFNLWEAYLQLGWHYLEYGKENLAIENNQKALLLSQKMLNEASDNQWLYAHSQGLQLKAWYEIDFGTLEAGIDDLIQAVDYAERALSADPDDIKKHHNQRILLNQLGYFLLEKQAYDQALPYVTQAVKLGQSLQSKAPNNLEYQRELAVSLSTTGEVFQQLDNHDKALNYYQQSLNISEFLANQDKNNFSTINDFAIDTLLVANLNAQLGYQKEAQELWQKAADLMRPIQQKEPNNKYYSHTLLVALLQLKEYQQAKPLYVLVEANGMEDQQIMELIQQHKLENWQNKKKGPE